MDVSADITEITQLVVNERYDRDHRRWPQFRAAYFDDSIVRISWFSGSGGDFVDATRERFGTGPEMSMHFVSAVPVQLHGNRAIAPTPLSIQLDLTWQDVPLQLTSQVIGFYGVEKREGRWGICSFECSYVRDSVIPVIPSDEIPIDETVLQTLRPSYRFLAYSLVVNGQDMNSDLPGVDRPDLVTAIEQRLETWAQASG